ncbi:MAG: hypothetical protein KC503_42030 [Myxococcales bacterium]|nr:hypothetical protein [Myxococcales bacterium]
MSLTLGRIELDSRAGEALPAGSRVLVSPILILVRRAAEADALTFAPDVVQRSPRDIGSFPAVVVRRSAPPALAPASTPAPAPAPARPAAPAEPANDNGLPEIPTRAAVREVLAEARPLAERCFDRGMVPGPVTLELSVRGRDGHVEHARVTPSTSTSKCVEHAAEALRFPRFARQRIRVVHRYNFR